MFSPITTTPLLSVDCPPGYTEHSIDFEYYSEEFQRPFYYTIEYCCKWDPQNVYLDIRIKTIYVLGGDLAYIVAVYSPVFRDTAEKKVRRSALDECLPPDIPDCNDPNIPYYRVDYRTAKCWQVANVWYTFKIGETDWVPVIRTCPGEANECIYRFKLCKDYAGGRLVMFDEECIPAVMECSTQIPQVPPPGKGWDEPWETECFVWRNCCP